MSEYILIGRERKTGKARIISDPSVDHTAQYDTYRELSRQEINDDLESVTFAELVPFKRTISFKETPAPVEAPVSDEKPNEPEHAHAHTHAHVSKHKTKFSKSKHP